MPNANDHLRGPWLAVLACRGDVYPTFDEASKLLPVDAEMTISIVRGSALPIDNEDGEGMREASTSVTYYAADIAMETEAWLVDPDDESLGAEVQYVRAQAMADGLNASGGDGAILNADEIRTAASFLDAYLRLAGGRVEDGHPVRVLAASLAAAADANAAREAVEAAKAETAGATS